MDQGELKYLISTEDSTNDLYVITLQLTSTLSYINMYLIFRVPVNLEYRYVIQEKKLIPKNSSLDTNIFVKSLPFTDSSGNTGYRIVIAGTTLATVTNPEHVFFAVFNTVYNITEYIFQENTIVKEICRSIEIDTNNNQGTLIISDILSNSPLDTSCIHPPLSSVTWNIAIRGFNFDRQVFEWTQIVGHIDSDDFYAASLIMGNFLILAFNTNHSHQTSLQTQYFDIEFSIIRSETGEFASTSCTNVFTGSGASAKVIDMVAAGNTGIYMLGAFSRGTIKYPHNSSVYDFSEDNYAIAFFALDTTSSSEFFFNLIDIELLQKTGPIAQYPPARIFIYNPSGIIGYGVPELVLASHLNTEERTGILFMSFKSISCSISVRFPASYNPFAKSSGCTDPNCQRCLSVRPDMCLDCADTYFLTQTFTCASASCPYYYYSSNGKTCSSCHTSCKTCKGPLRSDCLTCDTTTRIFNVLSQQCQCSIGYPYILRGQCTSACASGQSGVMANGNCRDKCPSYTFYYADYASSIVNTLPEGATEGNNMLQFTTDAVSCLKLPGPQGATTMPSAFTVSFWINVNPVPAGVLIWGFNSFKISSSIAGVITLDLIQTTIPLSAYTAAGTLLLNTWTYIAASVRPTATGHEILLYAATLNVNTNTLAGQDISNLPLSYTTYINSILLGCSGTLSAGGVMTINPGIQFSGNLRELVYMKRFHGLQSLIHNKDKIFSNCLQIYSDVLSYWRFDDIQVSPLGGYTLTDSSISAQTAVTTTNPTKSGTNAPTLCSSRGDILGSCIDLFALTAFPKYTVSLDSYAINGIEYRINKNDLNILSTVTSSQDKLFFKYNGCVLGSTILQLGVQQLPTGLIQIERGLSLPNTVYGKYLDVCYFSFPLGQTIKLGQLYVPNIPNHIYPSNGYSDSSLPSSITFSLTGGDQSIGDVITLYNLESNVGTASQDSILIDETTATFPTSSITLKLINGIPTYSSTSSSNFDPSIFTILWRPSYLTYQTDGKQTEFKNLFTTWAIQAIPSARFPEYYGIHGVYDNAILFKGELTYIDLVGPGQSDGDEILFCFTGCNYQYRQGLTYKRVNGEYPGVWLGEETGVSNLVLHSEYDRVYICWRPAARAAVTNASDDLWSGVPLLTDGISRESYLRINWQPTNLDLPEIIDVTPPMENAILWQGDLISFRISKCAKYKMKPSSYVDGTPGKIQVRHIMYSTLDHIQYTYEVIWEQQFPLLPDASNNGFTIGKLTGDPATCVYTIKNLQDETMIPGDSYQLIIFSTSFKSAFTTDFLFGVTTTNVEQFVYKFKYLGSPLNATYASFSPSTTQVTINGSYIGDYSLKWNGITEKQNLFGVNAKLYCDSTQIKTSYIIRNLKLDNPRAITLTDLDLGNCEGNLTLDLQLIKLAQMNQFPLWAYVSTKSTLTLGSVSCDSTCNTCYGATQFNCLTCDVSTDYQYLYNGQCLTSCPTTSPIAQIIIVPGIGTLKYFVCVTSCYNGYYLDSKLNVCLQCNAQCRSCTSGSPRSCTVCPGLAMQPGSSDTANTYTELYMFNHMCMTSCPVITNDLSSSQENLIFTYVDTRICTLTTLPQGSHPISVSHQLLGYPEKIDVGITTQLRAIVNDPTYNLTAISWSSFPVEDLTNITLLTSEQRTFLTYDSTNIASFISTLNMNSFNYKGDNNEMQILLKARTCDSLAFDLFTLYGNRAPTILAASINTTGTYTTMSYINLTVAGVDDLDDAFPVFTFKVQLQPRELARPDNFASLTTISASALQMLATLPTKTLSLTNSQILKPVSDNNKSVSLINVFIPPLINGPQNVANLLLSNVTCDIIITCQDRHFGLKTMKIPVNFTERFSPDNRSKVLAELYDLTVKSAKNNSMTWELALRIAHTFRIATPTSFGNYLAISPCSTDDQCSGNGKCISSGGLSECICIIGFTGPNCAWNKKDLINSQAMVKSVIQFLNITVIAPVSNQLSSEGNFTIPDPNVINQISSIISGLLQNPEVANEDIAPIVAQLCQYMTSIDNCIGQRLQDYEKEGVLAAIDVSMQFLYYVFRNSIISINNMMVTTDDIFVKILYTEKRELISSVILTLTESLYHFCDMISAAQRPGAAAFVKKQNTFEVFISSENADQVLSNLGRDFGIKPSETFGTIKFPKATFETIRRNVTIDGEFKIRLVKWTENPYIFSDHQSEICSSIMSIAILDSNSTKIPLNLTEPIVMLLPISNITKNLPDESVKCMKFEETNTINISYTSTNKVDVNLLNMSDASKKLIYPQWDPKVFSNQHLIVDENAFQNVRAPYPDFIYYDGISTYGDTLTTNDYEKIVICAAYSDGEVAAIVQNKKYLEIPKPKEGFYYQFDPMSEFKYCIGLYLAICILSCFCFFFVAAWIADIITIPRLEKIIELHRLEYSERDCDVNSSSEIPSIGNQNSRAWLVKQKGKDSEFFDDSLESENQSQMRKRMGVKMQGDMELVPNESMNEKQHESTVEKNKLGGENNVSLGESSNQDKQYLREKENHETIIPTLNQTTNQAFTTTPVLRTIKGQGSSDEYTFNDITADEIRAKGKRTIENIFSDEYIHRREVDQFTFMTMYRTSNLILNVCTVTSILFPRTTRCMLILVNILLITTFCAYACSWVLAPLDHADIYNGPQGVSFRYIWISFIVPLFATCYQYLFSSLYKVFDSKLLKAKILGQYKRYCRDYIRERKLRRFLGYVAILFATVGCSFYEYYYSVLYGYY